jgi:hypothetical protein
VVFEHLTGPVETADFYLGGPMKDFLFNLAVLTVIGIVLFVLFPDIMRQVLGLYDGLGILPVMVILVILAALPKRKRRKRN